MIQDSWICPNLLDIWKQKDNKNLIFISSIWYGSKGTTVNMWLYDYQMNTIKQVMNSDCETVNHQLEKIEDNKFKINFPDLNYTQEISIPEKYLDLVYKNKDIIFEGQVEFTFVKKYRFTDFDKDGYDELVTKRLINTGVLPWLWYYVNTYYKYIDGEVNTCKI
jgi:hypothetical protein